MFWRLRELVFSPSFCNIKQYLARVERIVTEWRSLTGKMPIKTERVVRVVTIWTCIRK
jgi:hypothetical protein